MPQNAQHNLMPRETLSDGTNLATNALEQAYALDAFLRICYYDSCKNPILRPDCYYSVDIGL